MKLKISKLPAIYKMGPSVNVICKKLHSNRLCSDGRKHFWVNCQVSWAINSPADKKIGSKIWHQLVLCDDFQSRMWKCHKLRLVPAYNDIVRLGSNLDVPALSTYKTTLGGNAWHVTSLSSLLFSLLSHEDSNLMTSHSQYEILHGSRYSFVFIH